MFDSWSTLHLLSIHALEKAVSGECGVKNVEQHLTQTACRALELALLYKKTHLDTVLWYRQKYLQSTKHDETKPQFLHFAQQVVTCFQFEIPA